MCGETGQLPVPVLIEIKSRPAARRSPLTPSTISCGCGYRPGSVLDPSMHLIKRVGEEVIESLDPDKTEARVLHISHDVERDR